MIAHKYIRFQSTWVKLQILTTFEQNRRTNKETTHKKNKKKIVF